jgi:hypothetical protein
LRSFQIVRGGRAAGGIIVYNRGVSTLVPNRILFRFEFPLRHRTAPRIDGDLSDWPDEYLLPDYGALDGARSFAKLWAGWNEQGLFLACRVEGRREPFQCDPGKFWQGDNIRVMTDMRDTRDLRRASRYCQQFFLLPAGGIKGAPVAGGAKLQRAVENAPVAPAGALPIASRRTGAAYTVEAHIPAQVLAGFEPDEHRRIGLFVMVEDIELGQQSMTVGDDLYWYVNPGSWPTAVLTPA